MLRAIVGARELDVFLTDKDAVAKGIEESVRRRASALGLEIASVGIRDVILPGDMKVLMNKVTEAKKAAEANLISRREETAALSCSGYLFSRRVGGFAGCRLGL